MFNAHILNEANQYAMPEELDYLIADSLFRRPKNIVMLGAGPGVLAVAAVQERCSDNKCLPPHLTIIDNVSCDYARQHLYGVDFSPEYLRTWQGDSAESARYWSNGPIDLLIIDADHSTEAVIRDVAAWFKHVKVGGLIFFHDYLERDGGFNGTGAWSPGPVAKAIEYHKDLAWKFEAFVGISAVYKRK